MIGYYKYCGISKDEKRIWGSFNWVDSEWHITGSYLFWGSVKSPIIKLARSWASTPKKQKLSYRIAERRSEYSDYIEIKEEDIEKKLPELKCQIESYFLMKKLKQ